MATNDNWLALVQEETLEPDLPICDPHHHLWDQRPDRVEPRYMMDEILADLNSGHNIVSTVFVQCTAMHRADGPEAMRPVGETGFVNGIAAMSASGLYGSTRIAAGIVGTADLTLGDAVGEVLEAHVQAGGGRFRGIRQSAAWDPAGEAIAARMAQPHLYMDANFRTGYAQLARFNMTFEGWCYHHQIKELTDLARAFPDTIIILDHFGGPLGVGPYAGKREELFEPWRQDMTELAKCANVVAKLGGINMPINGFGWHEHERPPTSQELMEATRPYYEHAIEQFGVDRCMFESNYPVDKESCSYNILWNSFKRLTVSYSADEKAKLYHDTAARVYRLS
ncbi:MAG: amidohydrolase [Candidatus Entotheonella gemina]|uniref:Amidohydrolase n=1 Tax=Candidatus Entotheonella gemina TaxID=1429439 RepID=W4LFB1_9BACT|nr:MAG: amidohydrolase [Candidatus Entotheonella gemina]